MINRRLAACLLALATVLGLAAGSATYAEEKSKGKVNPRTVNVVMETEAGNLEIELYVDRAPVTAGQFLAYVDRGLYADGGTFYRVVRKDNDNGKPVIEVLQGGISDPAKALGEIAHESTRDTGIRHLNGVISLGRGFSAQANGAGFFICIGDQPGLDYGEKRNPDGLGFAAFGKVVKGMDVVRKIHKMSTGAQSDNPYTKGQILDKPVRILKVYRKSSR